MSAAAGEATPAAPAPAPAAAERAASAALPIATAAPILRNTGVAVGKTNVTFTTLPQLKNVWQTYADLNAPKEFASNADLLKYMRNAAATLLTDPAARGQFSEISDVIRQFENQNVAVAMRAIAVGGRGITELRVRDNMISGFMQGIVVGVSHKERKPPTLPADATGCVTIAGNAVRITINPIRGYMNARYGIFVGNVNRLQIENNEVVFTTTSSFLSVASDGIRVYGYLGPKVVVRHNDVQHFTRGVVVSGLQKPGVPVVAEREYRLPTQKGTQWLVADNLFEGVRLPIVQQACMLVGNMAQ